MAQVNNSKCFLSLPNNWANLVVFKSAFSTMASIEYKYRTGEEIPLDGDCFNFVCNNFKSYQEIKDRKKFIIYRPMIDRCISLYNEMITLPESHKPIRKFLILNSIPEFILSYFACKDPHAHSYLLYYKEFYPVINEFTFVHIKDIEKFARNELGYTGEWIKRNTSNYSSNELKEHFYRYKLYFDKIYEADIQIEKTFKFYN